MAPAILAAGLLIAQQVAGKATRDAFFLSQFDVRTLPLMSGAAAILSLLAVFAFARGMASLSPSRVVPLAVALSGALLVAEWGLSGPFPRQAAVAVYLHTAVFGAILVSGMWSLINERFDPYSAKRAVGPIGMGASLGGVIGGLTTWGAASLVSVPAMLVGMAALNLLCLPPLLLLRSPTPSAPALPARAPEEPSTRWASGLRLIREVAYLRNLALLVGLCAFIEALLDYVFTATAATSFAKGGALMSFFALFHAGLGLASLALQATLIRPSLARLGLAGTLAVQPAAMALGSAAAAFFPSLWPIVLIRGGQSALRNSLFRSAYELFYTPLAQDQKRPTKTIVDVGLDRLGTAAGSVVVLLVLLTAPAGPIRILLVLAALSAGLTLLLAPRFDRGYVTALAESLRSGAVTLDAGDVLDATTRLAVAEFGGVRLASTEASPDNPERTQDSLPPRTEIDSRVVSDLIPLLAKDDLFGGVVKSLRKVAPRCTGQLLDALLDPSQDPVVRRRIPRVLRSTPTQRAADGLLLGLRDERLDLRYRCAQALVRMKKENRQLVISREEAVSAALREIALGVRSGRGLDHVFSILSLVLEMEPLEIALRALRSGQTPLRGTALEYLENVLPEAVRKQLWPHLGSPAPAPSGRSPEEIRDDLLRSTAGSKHSTQKRRLDSAG